MSANRLVDKVALVTCASRGIGRPITLRFAGEGARVVVNYEARSAATMDQFGRIDILSNASLCSKAVAPIMPRGPLHRGLLQQLEAGA